MTSQQRRVHAFVVPLLFAAAFITLMLLTLRSGK